MRNMFAYRTETTEVSDTVEDLKTKGAAEVLKISPPLIDVLQLNLSFYLCHGVSSRSV